MQSCLLLWFRLLPLCCCLLQSTAIMLAEAVSAPSTLTPWATMRQALHEALQWRFTAASAIALGLEQQPSHTLEAQLVRGIIAYFQARWQMRAAAPSRQADQVLSTLLERGQRQLARSQREPRLQLLVGTAAVFYVLLQQQRDASPNFALLAQARTWLQQALLADETMPDAHLGLGLVAFARPHLPWLFPRRGDGTGGATEAIYHLRRAAEHGYFSAEVAQTFLVRVYEVDKRYQEAIALGQTMQARFPSNGYYALVVGRSQYAQGQYASCAATLGPLARALQSADAPHLSRDDRFDVYYFLGRAFYETTQDVQAFAALRQAINQDPGTAKDASLWAKYYLALLYERRGETHTARQLYQTLLRGRNVEDLHVQVAQRLDRLP